MNTYLIVIIVAIIVFAGLYFFLQKETYDMQQEQVHEEEIEAAQYEEVIGRDDVDIQSQQTYTFSLPREYRYELQGVDAQSVELWVFDPQNQQVLTAVIYDHTSVNWIAGDPNNTQVQGHTIFIVHSEDEDALEVFKETLRVSGEKAFN